MCKNLEECLCGVFPVLFRNLVSLGVYKNTLKISIGVRDLNGRVDEIEAFKVNRTVTKPYLAVRVPRTRKDRHPILNGGRGENLYFIFAALPF